MGNLDTVPGIIKLYGGGVLKKGQDSLPEHGRVHVEVHATRRNVPGLQMKLVLRELLNALNHSYVNPHH